MKILQIAGSGTIGTNDMGPVSNGIFQLSNQFKKLGHDVTIVDAVANEHRKKLPPEINIVEIKMIPRSTLPSLYIMNSGFVHMAFCRLLMRYSSWLNEYRFIRGIVSKLNINEFDIIHVHEREPAFILQKIFKVNCVYTSHTPSWINPMAYTGCMGIIRKLRLKLLRLLITHESNIIKKCLLTIGLGDYLREEIPNANIITIPNGTDLGQWSPVDKKDARKLLGFSESDFILLFVGRIAPIKGVDILLKAVRLLKAEINDLRVIVIGSLGGSFNQRKELNSYSQMILKQGKGLPVEFQGFVSNISQEFQTYLSMADLFVLPSIFEPQGVVVLEALSMGVPVVASRTGGVPQMVPENVGRLFESGDYLKLAETIKYFYNHPEQLKYMSQFCRPHIEKSFTWYACALQHIKAYEELRYNAISN